MIIIIKVVPNARESLIDSYKDNILKIKIKAPPDKGKANEELIDFLSKKLKIAKSRIHILSGHTSRLKRVEIEGLLSWNPL